MATSDTENVTPDNNLLPTATSNELTEAPADGIRAFDQDGNEVLVPREDWRTQVLPGMLQETRDNPEQLYILIINSLNDGFVAEVTEAAAHLAATDTIPARGACTLAIVYIQSGRLDEAEKVLTDYLSAHGDEGSILINLAKVYASRDQKELAESTLWRGMELEPNQENGLGWLVAEATQAGGDPAAKAALERVRALDGSWRPQLWLARAELMQSNLGNARELYREALARAPQPVPPELLMQMSSDLGTHGHLTDLVELTGPHFIPEQHGLPIGNNLIKASVDLGHLDQAARIKDALAAFGRPDWQGALSFWDGEIARRRVGATNSGSLQGAPAGTEAQIQVGMLRVDGPIWLPPTSPARKAFGDKPLGPIVTFLGGSAETPEDPSQAQLALGDALGRMTRSLPLYLAEQVEMRTAASGRAMIPWALGAPGQPSGFIVSGQRWPDQSALQAVGDPANRSEYVVTVHVDAEVEPWEASLVFLRASDGTRIGELEVEFPPANPEEALPRLADEMVELLSALGSRQTPAAYTVPAGASFPSYLLRLEQLLAVRCAGMEGVGPQFLNGEREVLEGDLDLCKSEPTSAVARLLLVETMGAMARFRPEVVEEFRETFEQLQRDQPVAVLDEAFAS